MSQNATNDDGSRLPSEPTEPNACECHPQAPKAELTKLPNMCPTELVLIRSPVAAMRAVDGADPDASMRGHAELPTYTSDHDWPSHATRGAPKSPLG
jgi:hypothetical protein